MVRVTVRWEFHYTPHQRICVTRRHLFNSNNLVTLAVLVEVCALVSAILIASVMLDKRVRTSTAMSEGVCVCVLYGAGGKQSAGCSY